MVVMTDCCWNWSVKPPVKVGRSRESETGVWGVTLVWRRGGGTTGVRLEMVLRMLLAVVVTLDSVDMSEQVDRGL